MPRGKGMPEEGQERMWVIFASPEQHNPGGVGNRYFGRDGVETDSRSHAG